MNRDDFKILDNNIVYFDNGATTLKPDVVREAIDDYYNRYTSNIHRGDYQNSIMASICNKHIDTLYALLKNTEYDKIPLAIETWYTTLLPLVLEEAQ